MKRERGTDPERTKEKELIKAQKKRVGSGKFVLHNYPTPH
jgi:hypothetical protein